MGCSLTNDSTALLACSMFEMLTHGCASYWAWPVLKISAVAAIVLTSGNPMFSSGTMNETPVLFLNECQILQQLYESWVGSFIAS